MEQQVIIPNPQGAEGYVELTARPRQATGTVFRKHILNLGTLIHPKTGEKLTLDEAWFDRVRNNFDDGTCDIVQVPLADGQNQHTEDPLRNAGEVIGLERNGKKVYSIVDIRKPEVVQGLRDKTILGASAMLNLDYMNTDTGSRSGPTLLHHCITNRPYVTGLEDYEEIVAATVPADNGEDVVVLAAEEPKMDKNELIAALKEHGIDVPALEAAAAAKPDTTALMTALTQALQGTGTDLKLTGGDGTLSLTDVAGAIAELADTNVKLSGDVQKLQREGAEREVDGYIGTGRVLPKQRNAFIALAMNDRDTLAVMLPDEPVVTLNNPTGVPGEPQGEQSHIGDIDAELQRLVGDPRNKELFERQAPRPGSVHMRGRRS